MDRFIVGTTRNQIEGVNHIVSRFLSEMDRSLGGQFSSLAQTMPDYVSFPDIPSYVELVVDCLELIPPEVTIHRMTGDAPREILISPRWSFNKRTILNSINERMNLLDTWQGKRSK